MAEGIVDQHQSQLLLDDVSQAAEPKIKLKLVKNIKHKKSKPKPNREKSPSKQVTAAKGGFCFPMSPSKPALLSNQPICDDKTGKRPFLADSVPSRNPSELPKLPNPSISFSHRYQI